VSPCASPNGVQVPHTAGFEADSIVPETEVIYVQLLDEGVDVWRPVDAEVLANGNHRLPDTAPEDEKWAFQSGSIVRCERQSDGLIAVEAIRSSDS
jgi:hypothetical protein